MITPVIQQHIFEVTQGNLKVQEFSTADEVLTKLDDIREKMKLKDPIIYGEVDYWDCPVQTRFTEVYDIEPVKLMNLLGN